MEIGMELRARRRALGLSPKDLSILLAVGEGVIADWESNHRHPKDPDRLRGDLNAIRDLHDQLVSEIVDQLEETEITNKSLIETYWTNDAYWEIDAYAREHKIPASLHNTAAAHAQQIIEAKYSTTVSIERALTRKEILARIADILDEQNELDLDDPEESFTFDTLDFERISLEHTLKERGA